MRGEVVLSSVDEVLSHKGKWPGEIFSKTLASNTVQIGGSPGRLIVPDLSLLRGEWYFTEPTGDRLVDLLGSNVLFAGTPTLAERVPGSLLVDSSPWASDRMDLSRVRHARVDFGSFWADDRYEYIVIDPPWYFPGMINWINNASFFSKVGTKLVFPLFGGGTRPSAQDERNNVIAYCQNVGTYDLLPNFVEYETPRFEREALKAAGISVAGSWRVSDLIILTIKRPPAHLVDIRQDFGWVERRIGSQLVAVKARTIPNLAVSGLLNRVPGVRDWTLDSVSRRDERWRSINVWTSGNRVAFTDSPERIVAALNILADSGLDDQASNLEGDARTLLSWVNA